MASASVEGYTWESSIIQQLAPMVFVEVAAVQGCSVARGKHPSVEKLPIRLVSLWLRCGVDTHMVAMPTTHVQSVTIYASYGEL